VRNLPHLPQGACLEDIRPVVANRHANSLLRFPHDDCLGVIQNERAPFGEEGVGRGGVAAGGATKAYQEQPLPSRQAAKLALPLL